MARITRDTDAQTRAADTARRAVVAAVVVAVAASGCKSSEGHDRDEVMAEMRHTDELFRAVNPPIPMSQAVGCDVCPGVCRSQDLSELIPMPELIRRFRALAIAEARSRVEGHFQDAYAELERLACITARHGPDAELQFLTLLRDDNPPVRLYAATLALSLGFAIEDPLDVLRDLLHGHGVYSTRAWGQLWLQNQEDEGKWTPSPYLRARRARPHVR